MRVSIIGVEEGSETFTLRLSKPSDAVISDGEATVTIKNTDALPKEWTARFGRTVASQVVDAIGERDDGGGESRITIAGRTLNLDGESVEEELERDETLSFFDDEGPWINTGEDTEFTAKDALVRTSFQFICGGGTSASTRERRDDGSASRSRPRPCGEEPGRSRSNCGGSRPRVASPTTGSVKPRAVSTRSRATASDCVKAGGC